MDKPAASVSTFTHEPLPDPAKYIRLLELLDDDYSTTIKVRCRLTTWPIDSAPPYHAISYTWGDAGSNATILMNDKALRVRTNCEFTLKQAYWYRKNHSYLYRKWRPRLYEQSKASWYSKCRYFWLDSICIDQTNLGEKSKQVAIMGSIYKVASHVLACIGDHTDDSLFFFQSLYGLTHYVVRPRDMIRNKRFKGAGVSLRFRLLHRYSTTHRFVLALARLAVRAYFTRMWILQELQHAQRISILCGKYVLPRDDAEYLFGGLLKDLESLKQDPTSFEIQNPPHFALVHHRFLRRHVWHGFPHPVWYGDWIYRLPDQCMTTLAMLRQKYVAVKENVLQLLKEVVCRLKCEDPRDKVYGMISLIDWGDVPPLVPDYTHDDLEVAVRFIKSMMRLVESQQISEPIWKFFIITIKLLSLNTKSRGVADALEERRGAPEDFSEGAAAMPTRGSTALLQQRGWRLSQEDIDKNASKLQDLQATPPKYPQTDVSLLPRWARANDWAIEVETRPAHDLWYERSDARYQMLPTYTPLLIMREGKRGHRNTLIGYGFYYSNLRTSRRPWLKQEGHATIDVYFEIEDAILFLWRMKLLYELHPDSKDWMIPFLETSVCRQQTPGSSYAVLSPILPAPIERTMPTHREAISILWPPLHVLRFREFVLFDTKARRGWLINGHVLALKLLCAYLRNTPQTEPFDISKLNHIDGNTPESAYKALDNWKNKSTPIFRVLEDNGNAPEHGDSSQGGQVIIEKKLIVEVLDDIYQVLMRMDPMKSFPGEWRPFLGIGIKIDRHRNTVVKGWDFQRIYRTNSAKIYTHVFEKAPVWLGFVRELPVSFIFGSDLGEIIQPDDNCCPYFKSLPNGQDYLAVGMATMQTHYNELCYGDEPEETVARVTIELAWKRGVDPFSHTHGQGDHLEQVDSKCFPVQRLVKAPAYLDRKDQDVLRRKKGKPYSWKEVEDMNTAPEDMHKPPGDRHFKTGRVVLGRIPDKRILRELAEANLHESLLLGGHEPLAQP